MKNMKILKPIMIGLLSTVLLLCLASLPYGNSNSKNVLVSLTDRLIIPAKADTQTQSGYWGQCKYTFYYHSGDTGNNTLCIEPSEKGNQLGTGRDRDWSTDGLISNAEVNYIILKPNIVLPPDSSDEFRRFQYVTRIDGLNNLNTSHVTDMKYMFADCSELTNLDGLSEWNTENVTNMSAMFNFCKKITNLNPISNWNLNSVTTMNSMFQGCFSLTSLAPISTWDTTKVSDMRYMFSQCSSLSNLDDLSNWKTGNVTSMEGMFQACFKLTNMDGISNWDTSKVNNVGWMFNSCIELLSGNFSKWNASHFHLTNYMFNACLNLQSLNLSTFNTSTTTEEWNMFLNTPKLWKIQLGSQTHINFTANLGDVPAYDTPIPDNLGYVVGPKSSDTPKWQNIGDGSDHNPLGPKYSTSELENLSQQSDFKGGTFVWQQEANLTDLKVVPQIDLTVGGTWNPKDGFISATDKDGKDVDFSQIKVGGAKVDTSKAGTYKVTYTYGGITKTTNVVVKAKVTPNPVNPTPNPKPTPTPTNPNWNPSNPNNPNGTGLPNYAAVKGSAVYATKKIYMYKHGNFKKLQRITTYPKQKRINRPMFVVTGYTRSNGGALRYKVRDVNHHSKTAGKHGYITANRKYVVKVYYQSVPKKKLITVINSKGVHAYKNRNLTKQVKHYKKGSHLRIKKIVKWNLTTRYQLTNGHYVTANKKLVIQGKY